MPEAARSRPGDEPANPPRAAAAVEKPLLSRRELELPDGRYLLLYSNLEPGPADA
ncbi:MAG: hypothetical protein M3Z98_01135 [Candidatus Dormibacteraeota bacterium]|nr:hypothetical protein [Candidatus Dormibacteraeota bacterium]